MSFETPMGLFSRPAAADLSSSQYLAVVIDSNGNCAVQTSGGADITGILQNTPVSGDAANICTAGVSKGVLGATVASGALVMTNTSGQFITATSTNFAVGRVIVGGVSGDIVAIHVRPSGKQ